jgi:glycosyltransferase involved in cell wall biosynthesis
LKQPVETKELMMKYHVVLDQAINLGAQDAQAQNGQCPRHVMWQLAQRLNAAIHMPHDLLHIQPQDRLWSRMMSDPKHWALAREIVRQTGPEDIIFCNSEVSGLPIAALCRNLPNRPKLAVFVHNLDRPRGRLTLQLTQAAKSVDWFVACSQFQTDFLRKYLHLPPQKASFIWDQTDLQFFSPGPKLATKPRPIVMSVGLERRDYRTLAAATTDLPIDVKISGFSTNAKAMNKAFPDVMPENMSQQYYEWVDLLQLYREADVVVVSTFPSRYAAGVQVMMEAMACGRPVIVTQTEGLEAYLQGHDGVVQVPPGDAIAMRAAIVRLLENREAAAQLSQQALSVARERHNSERYIETLVDGLQGLQTPPSRSRKELIGTT